MSTIPKYYQMGTKYRVQHVQCVSKFEHEEMKTAEVTDYTNQKPPKHFRWIKFKF